MVISWTFTSFVKFKSAVWAVFGFLVVSAFISCEKGPGEGGTSAIVGNVEVDDFQNGETYPGVDEDVYLIYGDDITYSERIKTSFDGRFEFKYLMERVEPGFYLALDDTNHVKHYHTCESLKTVDCELIWQTEQGFGSRIYYIK